MKDDRIVCFIALLVLVTAVVAFIAGSTWGFGVGYKDACENFYTGSLRMELKETPEGERIWEWKK